MEFRTCLYRALKLSQESQEVNSPTKYEKGDGGEKEDVAAHHSPPLPSPLSHLPLISLSGLSPSLPLPTVSLFPSLLLPPPNFIC